MRITRTMERNSDSTGWAVFATVFGMLIAPQLTWVAQFASSMLMLIAGIVVAHFVKRELNRRWPTRKPPENDTEED